MPHPFSEDLAGAPSSADRALKALQQAKYVKDLWITMASVVAFLTVLRLLNVIITHRRINSTHEVIHESKEHGGTAAARPNQGSSARYFPSALSTMFRIVAFRWTVWAGPGSVLSITEFTFVFGYIALMLLFTFIDTRNLKYVFWEDRAAHLASCQVALIIALAGKNNFISWLTGLSHEKLNVLHRAAGRTSLILLWIHGLERYLGGLPPMWSIKTVGWVQSGALGLAALTVAAILSLRIIRNRFFEFFLVTHILLIAVYIVGGYIHARMPSPLFGAYLWPGLVIWAFDRVLRLVRVIVNSRGSTAQVDMLGSDTVRVTMSCNMNWKAGQHAYLIVPSVGSLQAHPFTIATSALPIDGSKSQSKKEVVFLIRGRNGFTRRLQERAMLFEKTSMTALIDGPYGCPPNLKQFTTCVLIAGGSGVSYTLPLLTDLVAHARRGSSQCRRVVFVWAVRDPVHIKWISGLLLEALKNAPATLTIDARVYITRATRVPSLSASSSNEMVSTPTSDVEPEKKLNAITAFAGVKTEFSRPDVSRILDDEITSSPGRVSVDVAGPHTLATAVRKALRSDIAGPAGVLRGRAPVVLHTETFGSVKQ